MTEPNSSILHPVPVMIQPQSWACWYTSFQMVKRYETSRQRGSQLKDPADVPWIKAIFDANHGIGTVLDEREKVALALGYELVFASLTAGALWNILRDVPVIYAGQWPGQPSGHYVVLTGISEDQLQINNPATGHECYSYEWFVGWVLQQTAERPLVHPPR